jgi:uncharacterized SAM-binding protein YcdF (DUF218 family)
VSDAIVNHSPVTAPTGVDAIVVLGCRVLASGRPSAALSRRILTGARAYRAGLAPKVIASGGRRWGVKAEACAIAEALARAGVPDEAIVVELRSLSTRENARYVAAALGSAGILRIAVATCHWHLPRALANFRALGVDAIPLAAESASLNAIGDMYRTVHEGVCAWSDTRGARPIMEPRRSC